MKKKLKRYREEEANVEYGQLACEGMNNIGKSRNNVQVKLELLKASKSKTILYFSY